MAIRELLNDKRGASIAAIAVLFAVAAGIGFLTRGGGGENASAAIGGERGWFTVDDGATWFPLALTEATPTRDGKPMYRLYLYACEGEPKPFVSFLERNKPGPAVSPEDAAMEPPEVEVKRPGGTRWINLTMPAADAATRTICPHGGKHTPKPVFP